MTSHLIVEHLQTDKMIENVLFKNTRSEIQVENEKRDIYELSIEIWTTVLSYLSSEEVMTMTLLSKRCNPR